MKILAMGLIHKNNTDNQPIEYVYRTLIKLNIGRLICLPVCLCLDENAYLCKDSKK